MSCLVSICAFLLFSLCVHQLRVPRVIYGSCVILYASLVVHFVRLSVCTFLIFFSICVSLAIAHFAFISFCLSEYKSRGELATCHYLDAVGDKRIEARAE